MFDMERSFRLVGRTSLAENQEDVHSSLLSKEANGCTYLDRYQLVH